MFTLYFELGYQILINVKSASKFIYLFFKRKYLFQRLQTIEIYLKIAYIDSWVHEEKSNSIFTCLCFNGF